MTATQSTQAVDYAYVGFYKDYRGQSLPGTLLSQLYEWDAVQKQIELMKAASPPLSLQSISASTDFSGFDNFLAVFTPSNGTSDSLRTQDWDTFLNAVNTSADRLVDFAIQGHGDGPALDLGKGNNRYYIAVWEGWGTATSFKQELVHDLAYDAFVTECTSRVADGWRLVKIQTYPTAGVFHITGLFEQTPGKSSLMRVDDKPIYEIDLGGGWNTSNVVDVQVIDDANGTRSTIFVVDETQAEGWFIHEKHDWPDFSGIYWTLSNTAQQMRIQKAMRYPVQVQVPNPQWSQYITKILDSKPMGYAFCVMKDGVPTFQSYGDARAAQDGPVSTDDPSFDPTAGATPFTADTRMNLASVSKSICGVAVIKMIKESLSDDVELDKPFWPLLQAAFPADTLTRTNGTDSNVELVTLKNLLQMKSGMPAENGFQPDNIWDFLTLYLRTLTLNSDDIGTVEAYSNANFTILQAVVECVAGHANADPDFFATWVTDNVLTPMGIDSTIFNPVPDAATTATLSYYGSGDLNKGQIYNQTNMVGAAGWITSATELIKFLAGLRNNSVLDEAWTEFMFQESLGWYTYNGLYGQYFSHDGGFGDDPHGIRTIVMRLSHGYDCVLLMNSASEYLGLGDVAQIVIQAFETPA